MTRTQEEVASSVGRGGVRAKVTPVMQQFFRAKQEHPDAIVFFRLGDFYEMFFEDAVVASQVLDIALTSRGTTPDGKKIPMAGVPHHASAGYLARLLESGRKVALCEQMGDPSKCKGVVPREVVRVVTPGLCVEPDALDARTHNYCVCVVGGESGRFGLAALDLSTAELRLCECRDAAELGAEVVRLDPREILACGLEDSVVTLLRVVASTALVQLAQASGPVDAAALEPDLQERLTKIPPGPCRSAAVRALHYARANQPGVVAVVQRIRVYDPNASLLLDEAAVRNLELVRTLGGERKGSLLALLDHTRTPMGARVLRARLLAPLKDVAAIRRRHDAVELFLEDAPLRDDVQSRLGSVSDLERLAARVSLLTATPRDLAAIRVSLDAAAEILERLGRKADERSLDSLPVRLAPENLCSALREDLRTTLLDEPAASLGAGEVFRSGVSDDLDSLRRLSFGSKDVVLDLERREREKTGIGSLKIRYTKVFGYYIEVTKANLALVPERYRRKQTVAGGERYTTSELDELQEQILTAQERSRAIEGELFASLLKRVAAHVPSLLALGAALADIDVHAGLAELAHRARYVRPRVSAERRLRIRDGRHPIVEQLAAAGGFVPNDTDLDAERLRMMIITGPNMAGKSTVMRQVALVVILAQMGSFVPAAEAEIGLVDRVFTRVGASDALSQGRSTFMVEMSETAQILREATVDSLVVLDEIGRGTSTYDGLAIAWAVAEHLATKVGCRALFATHYHELCELAEQLDGVANFNVAAREYGDEVVFLHRLVQGGANRSYGLQVARLAGVPSSVLDRAHQLLADFESDASRAGVHGGSTEGQLPLFEPVAEPSRVELALREIDVDRVTPIEALTTLARLKALL